MTLISQNEQVEKRNVTSGTYSGRGLTSKQNINVEVRSAAPGSGITFIVTDPKTESPVRISAHSSKVVNTLRNVVLGIGAARLCIVEHFLAAATLFGLTDLDVTVDGPEMPLGDGSALLWLDLFRNAGFPQNIVEADVVLKEPIVLTKKDTVLMAVPDDKFSIHYMMDWNHPLIGKRWQSFDSTQDIAQIGSARTFGWLKDHQMLGLQDDVVSLTADGFTLPLRFEDEPVRHKLLDLIGDLALCGINPMRFKAKFVSIKGGHELDVELAKRLAVVIGAI